MVVAPLPDSPAERAGIMTGRPDRGRWTSQSTAQWNQDQAVRNLRGPEDTHGDAQDPAAGGARTLIAFKLTRARIHARVGAHGA